VVVLGSMWSGWLKKTVMLLRILSNAAAICDGTVAKGVGPAVARGPPSVLTSMLSRDGKPFFRSRKIVSPARTFTSRRSVASGSINSTARPCVDCTHTNRCSDAGTPEADATAACKLRIVASLAPSTAMIRPPTPPSGRAPPVGWGQG
jgi:hypothetical protein